MADCARATGLTPKAIRRRIERGTLESVLVEGQRRIPVSALVGAGLLVEGISRGKRGGPEGRVQSTAVLQRLAAQRMHIAEELVVIGELEADARRSADELRRTRIRCLELEQDLARARETIGRLERAQR